MNYDTLQAKGEILETALEGTCQLWTLNGKEYVVLEDNTVITRQVDNEDNPIFPYE